MEFRFKNAIIINNTGDLNKPSYAHKVYMHIHIHNVWHEHDHPYSVCWTSAGRIYWLTGAVSRLKYLITQTS